LPLGEKKKTGGSGRRSGGIRVPGRVGSKEASVVSPRKEKRGKSNHPGKGKVELFASSEC